MPKFIVTLVEVWHKPVKIEAASATDALARFNRDGQWDAEQMEYSHTLEEKAKHAPEYKVGVWEERDRLHIHLFDGDENNTVAEWWDDDARDQFDTGYFKPHPNLDSSVLEYANEHGIITEYERRLNA